MRKKSGFTLIELMIVVAIIAIIAAIALPNLLRSRLQSNEASAIGNMRAICGAQIQYNAARGTFGTFEEISANPGDFIDDTWTEGTTKNGYEYTMPLADETDFTCFADPMIQDRTGVRHFRVDATGILRVDSSGQPAADAPPLGEQ